MNEIAEVLSFFVVLVTLFGLDSYRTNQIFERLAKLEDAMLALKAQAKSMRRQIRRQNHDSEEEDK